VRLGIPLVLLAILLAPATARADRDFAQRFAVSTHGDIVIVGNKLHDCPNDAGCDAARSTFSTTYFNNDHAMVQLDVDGGSVASSFNSSRATLDLPAGAEVRFAGLYWGATLGGTNGPTPALDPDERDTVRLDAPGGGGYEDVTADTLETTIGDDQFYAGFADVTDRVVAAGDGAYMVANVQSSTGQSTMAGWTLVVAYEAPGEALRNLTVFDGFRFMLNNSFSQQVSGFRTPQSGTVRSRVGAVAYEGEPDTATTAGEGLTVDGTLIGDALNPTSDFFNGSITRLAQHVTAKDPDHVNQIGSLDADVVAADGALGNSATDATVGFSALGDGWLPHVLTFATEVEQPLVELAKTAQDLDGGTAQPGDVIRYTVTARNAGNDDAEVLTVEDAPPAGTTFVPGSIRVAGASITDAADADAGELAAGTVVGRLGTLAPNATRTLAFDVRINDGAAVGSTIDNTAEATYEIPASAIVLDAASEPVRLTVAARDAEPVATPTPTPTPAPTPVPAQAVLGTQAVKPPRFSQAVTLPSTRRCVSRRRFRIRIRRLRDDPIVRAEVRVNGKRVRVVRGSRLRAPVDLRGLPKGRFKVQITVRTASGKIARGTRRYRTCTKRRKGGRPKL
jgi:uncharacterized repeat protein (TIGR01451 family)